MPTVTVSRQPFLEALGESNQTDEWFEDLCFQFGIELDEVTTEAEMIARERGEQAAEGAEQELLYKIEVPANRYDLLCFEGLVQALRIFMQKDQQPTYSITTQVEKMTVLPATQQIRPYVVAAILRNIQFNHSSFNSFLNLQEKLHQNICRRRTLVAIGTHDYDTIKGPFRYDAQSPLEIKFKALRQTEEMTAEQLMNIYRKDQHMKIYVPIIDESPVYPIIYDSNNVVLSMPPMINGEHSKMSMHTKNVFIECTATDLTKANIVLNTMISMFSCYCEQKFTVEPVLIEGQGQPHLTPDIQPYEVVADFSYLRTLSGVPQSVSNNQIAQLLEKMNLKCEVLNEESIKVKVPITRSDVIHACDIAEDVAIAYGYNSVEQKMPEEATIGSQFKINKYSDLLRQEVAQAGFTEVLSIALVSIEENFIFLNRPIENAVQLANPKTQEFQIVRTSLIPGMLKALASNKNHQLPIQIFEISDVVLKDEKIAASARNNRRLAAMRISKSSGFEIIHGLVDLIMMKSIQGIQFSKEENGY